ncbi:MAG TPA: hypothetical protein VFP76_05145 [Gemmatimonadota bacterium]|nr:hypothetical protein [Gemmatimonadota bacterium]
MTTTRMVRTAVLAVVLLVLPVGQVGQVPGIGPQPAEAASCKWKIEVCSEIDIYVWKGTVCVEYCARR